MSIASARKLNLVGGKNGGESDDFVNTTQRKDNEPSVVTLTARNAW